MSGSGRTESLKTYNAPGTLILWNTKTQSISWEVSSFCDGMGGQHAKSSRPVAFEHFIEHVSKAGSYQGRDYPQHTAQWRKREPGAPLPDGFGDNPQNRRV